MTAYPDARVSDAPVDVSTQPLHQGLTYNDVDMGGVLPVVRVADGGSANADHIPRPPYDPLTTGQKVAGVVDVFGSGAGGFLALNKYRNEGLNVLRLDLKSLDRVVISPELDEYRTLGTRLNTKVSPMASAAQDDVVAMQAAKPHLFESVATRGVWKGVDLRLPRYSAMNSSELAVVERASDLNYIAESLHKGVSTTTTANFRSGLQHLTDLDKNSTAISEGLSPELSRLQSLGNRVSSQVTDGSLSIAADSQALMWKNIGIVGLGIGANILIEKTLLKNSSPSGLTIATDIASPFIILTDLPLWAKFGVIVGAHALTRMAEYGMAKGETEPIMIHRVTD